MWPFGKRRKKLSHKEIDEEIERLWQETFERMEASRVRAGLAKPMRNLGSYSGFHSS